jgi:hypothetical protein
MFIVSNPFENRRMVIFGATGQVLDVDDGLSRVQPRIVAA